MTKRNTLRPSKAERLAGFYRPVGSGGVCEMYYCNYLADEPYTPDSVLFAAWGRLLNSTRED